MLLWSFLLCVFDGFANLSAIALSNQFDPIIELFGSQQFEKRDVHEVEVFAGRHSILAWSVQPF